jgi:excisionase family DNA binding protein
MEQTNDWITIAEATRLLKVGRTTLHRWLKQGRLRAHRVGPKAVRIRRADLDRLITPVLADKGHGGEVVGMKELESVPIHTSLDTIKPLTDEQQRKALAVSQASRELLARQRAKRGGKPFDESWPLIRASRDERSEQLA